jgi:hypothetical protein
MPPITRPFGPVSESVFNPNWRKNTIDLDDFHMVTEGHLGLCGFDDVDKNDEDSETLFRGTVFMINSDGLSDWGRRELKAAGYPTDEDITIIVQALYRNFYLEAGESN